MFLFVDVKVHTCHDVTQCSEFIHQTCTAYRNINRSLSSRNSLFHRLYPYTQGPTLLYNLNHSSNPDYLTNLDYLSNPDYLNYPDYLRYLDYVII